MAVQQTQHTQPPDRVSMAISKGWVQAVALVFIFGFMVMGILAYRTYSDGMPQPERVLTTDGQVLFTSEDITNGQQIFLRRGLQQYGSVLGHGGYLGPDYTAEYLRLASDDIAEQLRAAGVADPSTALIELMRTNRYDEASGDLVFTPEQVKAFEYLQGHYGDFFGEDSTKYGLIPKMITDPDEIHDLTAFFAWTAWASAAERPGHSYSYTNNWPPETRVANTPSADILV